jgi:hypothetical protein
MKEDGRKNNGGHKNSGRKSKAEEQKLIEKLSPFEKEAINQLRQAVEEGTPWAIKMYFEYMYGKPKMQVEADLDLKGSFLVDMNEWK